MLSLKNDRFHFAVESDVVLSRVRSACHSSPLTGRTPGSLRTAASDGQSWWSEPPSDKWTWLKNQLMYRKEIFPRASEDLTRASRLHSIS